MAPELGPVQAPWWQQTAAAVGAAIMSAILAWRAARRREKRTPYSPEKGAQPRIITRDEWHGAVQLINAWPGLTARVRRNETRLDTLEDDFKERMRIAEAQAQDFAEFRGRWEEVGKEARDHRDRLERHILRVEGKVDASLTNGKKNGSA